MEFFCTWRKQPISIYNNMPEFGVMDIPAMTAIGKIIKVDLEKLL